MRNTGIILTTEVYNYILFFSLSENDYGDDDNNNENNNNFILIFMLY